MHIDFVNVGRCPSCTKGEHDWCDHHMNDGAVDALEFIDVRCDCPCDGTIGTFFGSFEESQAVKKWNELVELEQSTRDELFIAGAYDEDA